MLAPSEPRRRLVSAGAAAALLAVLPLPCLRAQVDASGSRALEPAAAVVWLHGNDFHGQFRPLEALWRGRSSSPPAVVGGAASYAGYVRKERDRASANGSRVVVTDAGDWFQGTLEGNDSKGALAVDFLSRLGLDAAVVGNHEYDYGIDNLRALLARARFPVLGANIRVASTPPGEPRRTADYVRAFHVVDVHGLRVGVLGLISNDTKRVSGGPFGDVEFEAEEAAVRDVLPALRAQSDVVVLLTHCGLEADQRLARAFPEIPLILGGHSHTPLQQPFVVGDTWIVQTQGKATSVYHLDGVVHRAAKRLELRRGTLVELELDAHPPDPATQAWIDEQTKELAAKWDTPIGELVTPMVDTLATHSTAAGNWVCDVMLAAAGAELAFSNKGGLRTRLRPGPLTRRHVYELLPFDNTLVSLSLRGAVIRDLLQAAMAPGKKLPDLGGGTYTYELVDDRRVLREVTVGGAPLDPERTYRIAVSSFLADGNDSFAILMQGTDRRDHGVLVRDVVIAHVERVGRVVGDTTPRIRTIEAKVEAGK